VVAFAHVAFELAGLRRPWPAWSRSRSERHAGSAGARWCSRPVSG